MSDKTIQFRLSGAPYLAELLAQQAQAYQREGHRHSPSKMARDLAEAAARHVLTGEYVPPASLRGVTAPNKTVAPSHEKAAENSAEKAVDRAGVRRRTEAKRFLK